MQPPILMATDFSPRSDRALRRATMLAKQFDRTLSLVAVVDDDQPDHLVEGQAASARAILDETVRTLDRIDGVDAHWDVRTGDVFSGILEAAEELDPALIVLGPHRRQLRHAFTGTTAERTIALSRHPVLMTAGIPSSPYYRALVALDMDETSKAIAHRLVGLPLLQDAEIVAMHAFDAPAEGMMKRGMSAVEAVHHYVASEQRRAEGELRALLGELPLGGPRRLVLPINGQPGRTILEAAREQKAPLVVVGTSQKKGLKRLLLGSVAEAVLADADRDVLVIPQGCVSQERILSRSVEADAI